MKVKVFTLSLFLIATLIGATEKAYAQKETFDLVTYSVPQGWQKEVKPNSSTSFTITNQQKKSYCQIIVMMSTESKGGIKEDFESEWQGLIVKSYKVTDSPQITESTSENGWTVKAGVAQFSFNNENALAMLTTMSGYKKTVSVVTVTNSQDYVPFIQSFLGSVEMKVPDTNSNTTTENNISGPSIIGTWGIAKSGGAKYDDYKNPYAVNNYGYINSQYTFNENGTYTFYTKTFKMVFDKILLTRESGTYKVNGNQITIIPGKSIIEAWSKKDGVDEWGKLLSTQNRKLEKVTYQFTKHYFSGIQEWNLVLQAAAPTERDGPYSGNLTFQNSWLYGPISTHNPAIKLPPAQQITGAAKTKGK